MAGNSVTLPPSIAQELARLGQEHLLEQLESLPMKDKDGLLADLRSLDLERAVRIFGQSTAPAEKSSAAILPISGVSTLDGRSTEQTNKWRNAGLDAIAQGKLAVLLLAGGQGTRLGSSDPKGCYDIGLPSKKSLFQLQAERLLRMQKLAAARASGGQPWIPWYIMTSSFTHAATTAFFKSHAYFGLEPDQVRFFQQGTIPCFTLEGKVILETPGKIAQAPDGNGGVYAALKASGSLEDMVQRGVTCVECFSVDNALVRVADPLYLGFFRESKAPCAAKVVQKAHPEERVGVFVQRGEGGPVEVVEYSELDPAMAVSVDPATQQLRFLWSNVCMHLFTVDFLQSVTAALERDSRFHVALKNIPSVDGPVQGVKLEQFIFDVFPYAAAVALFEVARNEEFSPVKNASGAPTDSPATARSHLLQLHRRWLEAAGGALEQDSSDSSVENGVEVSPVVSYAGEGLDELCRGRTFPNKALIG